MLDGKIITYVYASTTNNIIGSGNMIPWHFPNDMKLFKKLTMNQTVVMGRKTFESLKKPLINRLNIVLTKSKEEKINDNLYFTTDILNIVSISDKDEIFVIGGSEIYKLFSPYVDKIHRTHIKLDNIIGDVYFPKLNRKFESIETITEDSSLKYIYYYSEYKYKINELDISKNQNILDYGEEEPKKETEGGFCTGKNNIFMISEQKIIPFLHNNNANL